MAEYTEVTPLYTNKKTSAAWAVKAKMASKSKCANVRDLLVADLVASGLLPPPGPSKEEIETYMKEVNGGNPLGV